jgi:hypothetical protein
MLTSKVSDHGRMMPAYAKGASQMAAAPDLKQQIVAILERLPENALADVATYVEYVAAKHDQALGIDDPDHLPDSTAFDDLVRLGRELARNWPAGIQSANVLSAMRDER